MKRCLWLLVAATALAQLPGETCARCHQKIVESFARTGMGRAFSRPSPANTIEDYTNRNSYYHEPSDIHYQMVERGGRYYQRQWQIDSAGHEINAVEKQIDYVLGSGNHARTYLHRTPEGLLQQLPLGWYSEKGGEWAMNPGYDRPDHQGFRRNITYDCMFCHNAYPEIPAGHEAPRSEPVFSRIPEGIDCARCHGPGEKHAALAAGSTATGDEIRAAIVNPARLPKERQIEVCLQCHLETTSSPLPASIVRYERAPFSYRPGEPLSAFMLHFDRATKEDRFEITGSAYRLRQSQCFLKSAGKLMCTTCHDPHGATRDYAAACKQCHTAGEHVASATDCIGCHMPKRRTTDVVHVVMTDHLIQRRPAATVPVPINPYRGEVVPYLDRDELYLAIAQVTQGSNLTAGLVQLRAALEKFRPQAAEYYLQFEEASGRRPTHDDPLSALHWMELGGARSAAGQTQAAIEAFEKAAAIDPEMPEAWNAAGALLFEAGQTARAESALRNALRWQPNYAGAHDNLGNLLAETGRFNEAESHFRAAIRLQENAVGPRYNYALGLAHVKRFADARTQMEAVVRLMGDTDRAKLRAGSAMLDWGDPEGAAPYLRAAAQSKDAEIRAAAEKSLAKIR